MTFKSSAAWPRGLNSVLSCLVLAPLRSSFSLNRLCLDSFLLPPIKVISSAQGTFIVNLKPSNYTNFMKNMPAIEFCQKIIILSFRKMIPFNQKISQVLFLNYPLGLIKNINSLKECFIR